MNIQRRTFLKTILPTIFVPKLIVPVWKSIKPTVVTPPYYFPIIRQVFPNLVINNLISVQPLTEPTGEIFPLNIEQYHLTK